LFPFFDKVDVGHRFPVAGLSRYDGSFRARGRE
jgi:hypothetical protein